MGKRKAGITRGYSGVGHYIQGPGAIDMLASSAAKLGRTCAILIDVYFYDSMSKSLRAQFEKDAPEVDVEFFPADLECSEETIAAFIEKCRARFPGSGKCPQVLVGIGGGKAMDPARGAAITTDSDLIEVPTSASTNAATSCLAVIYDENKVGRARFLKKSPDYVIADTSIIAAAPARMLAAGIGDALATYYEARSCWADNNVNYVSGGLAPTITGKVVAKACRDTLLTNGRDAYLAVKNHVRTAAFEDTIEAIMLLSGIGWQNNGTAIAHALVEGVPTIPDTARYMHGECVAFCVLVQMIMDRDPKEDFDAVYSFLKDLHLPVCLADIGITENKTEKVRYIVDRAFEIDPGITIANYAIDRDSVYNAVMYLDALAQ